MASFARFEAVYEPSLTGEQDQFTATYPQEAPGCVERNPAIAGKKSRPSTPARVAFLLRI